MRTGKAALAAALAMAILAPGAGWGAEEDFSMAAEESATRLSQKGESASGRKNHAKALALHEAATRARMAMDDAAGAMVELYNSAVDLMRMGKTAEAEGKLAQALALFDDEAQMGLGREKDKRLIEAASLACFLKGMILAGSGATVEAEKWSAKAMSHCQQAGCRFKSRIMNQQGRLAMDKKDHARAGKLAAAALDAAKSEESPVEMANSIRLLAETAEAKGDVKKAADDYAKALAIDRELKLGSKIAMDLLGLARCQAKMARMEKALALANRALAVSQAAGYDKGAKEAATLADKYKQNPLPSR